MAKPRVLSAGAVVVRGAQSDPRFLLLRAFRHWDFPKGVVEPGEQPLAAALREVAEETRLDDLEFCWGHAYLETGPYSRNKIARYYIARTRTTAIELPVNPELGRPEHSEYRWVAYDQAVRLAAPRVREVLAWARSVLQGAARATPCDASGEPAGSTRT